MKPTRLVSSVTLALTFSASLVFLGPVPTYATCGGAKWVEGKAYDDGIHAYQSANGGKAEDFVINRTLDDCSGTYTTSSIITTQDFTFATYQDVGWGVTKVNGSKVWYLWRQGYLDGAPQCTPPTTDLPSAQGGRYPMQFRSYYVLINNIHRYRSEVDYEDGQGFQDLGYCKSFDSTEYPIGDTWGINGDTALTASLKLLQYKSGGTWSYWKTFLCDSNSLSWEVDKISDYAFDVAAGNFQTCIA